MTQVLLKGPSVDGAVTSAITECLASYAPVTTLASYGCDLGNQVRSKILSRSMHGRSRALVLNCLADGQCQAQLTWIPVLCAGLECSCRLIEGFR
jgi:hypothetical protein